MKTVVHPGCSLVISGDARGVSVTCVQGVLWLTQERDARDHVLSAGERFVVDRRGRVVISSPLDSEVALAGQRRRNLLGLPAWRARLALHPVARRPVPGARAGQGRAA
jgi:hypothetical protein